MPSSPALPPPPLAPAGTRSPGTRSSPPARSSTPAAGPTVPNEALRFAYIGLCDPPKDDGARRRRRRGRGGRPPAPPRPAAGPRGRRGGGHRVGHPGGDRPLGDRARRPPAAPDGGVDHGPRRAARASRNGTPPWTGAASSTGRWCRSTPGRPAPSGWATRRAGASPAAWPTCASPRRTTATPGPLEGLLAFVDMGRGEVLEVVDHGVVPLPPDARELLPRAQRAAAHGPQAAGDHPARGPELRGGRQPRALAEVVAAHRHGPAGGPRAVDGRVRGRRPDPARSSTGPRSARWWCPTGTRDRCTPGRARSTPANGAWAAWPTR